MATLAKAAAGAAVIVTILCGRADAGEPNVGAIVLHLRDYQGVDAAELADAQRLAADVYARIGVRLEWKAGCARLAPADGLKHMDIAVLDAAMTERDVADRNALGKASRTTRRANIYYPRVVAHAVARGSDPTRVLALVFAHEVGHMLLPDYSHAPRGIMQASWDRPIGYLPGFIREQALSIQALVKPVESPATPRVSAR
jgi:hypothetical protein